MILKEDSRELGKDSAGNSRVISKAMIILESLNNTKTKFLCHLHSYYTNIATINKVTYFFLLLIFVY